MEDEEQFEQFLPCSGPIYLLVTVKTQPGLPFSAAMSMICCILRLAVELPATHPPLDRAIAFHNPALEDIGEFD